MKTTTQFFASILFTLSVASGQQYVWPTHLGKAISSNFGEARPRRFHAGIDISTKGSTGHEVLAAGDGYLWRARVASDGYGRALYLKLNDGNVAVYAHLDRYIPFLNDIVKIEQRRNGAYAIDKYFGPDEFVVQKGDVVGFSGESGGASGPHLHFELRDSSNRPLNPLVYAYPLDDRHRPTADAVAIVPLSADAIINGSPLPQVFALRSTGPGEYELPDTIHVFGTVGLEISATDRISGFPNRYNIQGAMLSVDGIDEYRIEFDTFEFGESHLIEIERENSFRRLNEGEFHRLFTINHSRELNFIEKNSRGQLRLTPGYHRFFVRVFDHAKNVARIGGILYYAPPTNVRVTAVNESARALTVAIEPEGSPFAITDFVCYSFNQKGYVERKVEVISSRQRGRSLIVELPKSQIRNRILQLIGINKLGGVSFPFHMPVDAKEPNHVPREIDLSVSHLENSVVLQVELDRYVPHQPEVSLRGPGKDDLIEMIRVRPTTYLSVPLRPARLEEIVEINVSIHGSPARESRFSFKPKLSVLEGSVAAVSPDGLCSLQSLPSTFYDTTAFWVEGVRKPVPVAGGQFVSPTYQLQPFDRPLLDSARLAISIPKSVQDIHGLGIFYHDQKEGWTYLPTRFSESRWMFFTAVYSLEAVAVIRDTIKPIIKDVFPGDGGFYDFRDVKVLSAKIDDDLAGVKDETSIQLVLDDEILLFGYHPIKKTVTYPLEAALETGAHRLKISATDQVGNSAFREIRFSVN